MPHTALAPTTGLLWNTLKAEGIDPDPLFRQMGVDPDLMQDPTARVREKTVVDLWQKAIDLTGDLCLGIKSAKHWHPSRPGALGYAWLASSTLRTALDRAVRYMRAINERQEVSLKLCALMQNATGVPPEKLCRKQKEGAVTRPSQIHRITDIYIRLCCVSSCLNQTR